MQDRDEDSKFVEQVAFLFSGIMQSQECLDNLNELILLVYLKSRAYFTCVFEE